MKYIKWFTLLAVLLIIGYQVNGQTFTKYAVNDSSQVFVSGTSTLHNWKENLKKFTVTVLVEEGNARDIVFKNIQFSALVGDLKSEAALMDKKTFNALKKDRFPTISFSSEGEVKLSVVKNMFAGKVGGTLIIAGVKRQVFVGIKGTIEDGKISVSGIYPVSMSEYSVKAPTFLFGTIKAGNEVDVHFSFQFNKIQNNLN